MWRWLLGASGLSLCARCLSIKEEVSTDVQGPVETVIKSVDFPLAHVQDQNGLPGRFSSFRSISRRLKPKPNGMRLNRFVSFKKVPNAKRRESSRWLLSLGDQPFWWCMVRATHISPDCQSMLSQFYGVEPSGCREILCCKEAKSCGCAFLMGRALHPM